MIFKKHAKVPVKKFFFSDVDSFVVSKCLKNLNAFNADKVI